MQPWKTTLLWTVMLSLAAAAHPWGANGHRITGRIAEHHLSPEAAAVVGDIIGPKTLAQISTWSDEIRSDPDWRHAGPWHYISIDDDESFEDFERNPKGDVLSKLEEFLAVLDADTATAEELWQALAWVTHLVGDMHQPLHVGRRDDYGGNDIILLWFDEPSNLHALWDSEIIEQQNLSFTEYVSFIDHPTEEELADWRQGDIWDWARESFELRQTVYDIGNRDLGYVYSYEVKEVLERRMVQGGVRLAELLDRVLAGGGATAPAAVSAPE